VDETREVLTLYYREGRSTAQVAVLLDLDEAAVRSVSRAREALRADLLQRASAHVPSERSEGHTVTRIRSRESRR